ncbi:hypothetical protein C8F01DRAFT_1126574 [Mycena amicta]|nr:hypothetical protein C8F01DRAFT_1126574 [Mycena amicta]
MRNVRCEYPSDFYRVAQPTTVIHHVGLNHAREWSNQPDPYLPYTPAPPTNHPPRYSWSTPYASLTLQPPQPHFHWQSPYPYPSGGSFGHSGLHTSQHSMSPSDWASYGLSPTLQLGGGMVSGNGISDDQERGLGWPEESTYVASRLEDAGTACERTGDAFWGWQPLPESIDILEM